MTALKKLNNYKEYLRGRKSAIKANPQFTYQFDERLPEHFGLSNREELAVALAVRDEILKDTHETRQ